MALFNLLIERTTMLNIPTEKNGDISTEKLEEYLEELEYDLQQLEEVDDDEDTELTMEQQKELLELHDDIEDLKSILKQIDSDMYLIHEDNIASYIQEDVEDNWEIPRTILQYINWSDLVDDFMNDYRQVEINNDTYYWR